MENQHTIIGRVRALCEARKYDDAIELTEKIELKDFAVRAHLLVIEHEQRFLLIKNKA